MKILPWLAASAVDEPEMPAKKIDSTTFTCASPPGKWPTRSRDSLTSRSVMPPTFIRFAVSRKNGTASRMNELYDLNVWLNSTSGDRRGSMIRIGRHARPSANAIGTRSAIRLKKTPNRISEAIAGDRTPALLTAAPRTVTAAGAGRRGISRRGTASHVKPASGQATKMNGIGSSASSEILVPAELNELDAVPEEHKRQHQHEHVRNHAQQRVGARREFRPEVNVEVRAVADGDHRADHDHPDEEEPRHLLGPDVRRDQRRKAGEDLQADRDDQDRHGGDQQPVQEPVIAVDEFAHALTRFRIRSGRQKKTGGKD